MITEVRKAIGSEKKVSIDWVKKITLYKEEIVVRIATKELGVRKDNGTLVLREEEKKESGETKNDQKF